MAGSLSVRTVAIQVRKMGLTFNAVSGEYRISHPVKRIQYALGVTFRVAQLKAESMAYYTNDLDDALMTATKMQGEEIR